MNSARTVAALLSLLCAAAGASPLDDSVRLMAEKKYRQAVVVLEREARARPGSPDVLLNLGWAYWHAKRIDDAWRIGRTLVKLDPDNRTFLIFLANTDVERKDYETAIALMVRALKGSPGDHDASMVLARAEFLAGRKEEAMAELDRVLERFPGDPPASYRKAVFLADMGAKKEALARLDRLIESEPGNADYRRSRAKILSELGRQEEAKTAWTELTRGEPDAQSLMNLGWAYWKEKNYDAAWEIATLLMKLDDTNPTFLRFTANLEIERTNYAEALKLCEKAAAAAPEDRDVQLTLAKALFRLQREREAMAVLQKLVARYPENPAVQFRWAEFLGITGAYDESLSFLDRLIKLDPSNDAYRMNRASVLYEMGRYDEAVAEWSALATRRDPNPGALRRLRDDAFNRREWTAAVDWQRRIIAVNPADPGGWERLSKIYTAMKDLPKALWAAEQGIAADPVPINAYYLKAEALEGLQRWPEAKAAYEEIVARNPNSIRAFDGLSYVLEAQGKYKQALDALRRVELLTAPTKSPFLEIHKARLIANSGGFSQAQRIVRAVAAHSRQAIPVLLYHGVSRGDRSDGISQERLRAQLRAIKGMGYQPVTVSELDRAFHGIGVLPAKPIVLTFDDGRTDSFENADPVLRETGMKATMFVHVSKLRKPHFHASPEEIAKWQATGRWDMQAHGYQAHDPMPLDGEGRKGHFLPNRMWLASAKRMETLAEYRARVEDDYRRAKRGVEEIVPGHEVVAFAYPYGDYGQNDYSNTPESAQINQALVQKNFHLAFVQEQFGVNSLDSNPTDLRRYEVPRDMTAEQLATHLTMSDPRVQARMLEAQLWTRAEQPASAEEIYRELEAEGADPARVLADAGAAYAKGGDLSYARNLFSRAEELESDKEGPAGEQERKQSAQAARAAAPAASFEVQRFTDSDTNSVWKGILRGAGMAGPARVEGWAARGFLDDHRTPDAATAQIEENEIGAGLRWFPTPKLDLGGFYGRRLFSKGSVWTTDLYSAAASYQATPALKLSLRDGLDDVETASAVRQRVRFHTDGVGLVWDPALSWKLNADYDQNHYSDTNLEQDVRLRVTKRWSDLVSLGAAYLHGDSRLAQPQYYTPRSLNQYTGVLTLTQRFGESNPRTGLALLEATLQYEGGYGFQTSGSRAVHSGRAGVTARPLDRVSLSLDGQYSRSPTYLSRRVDGSVSVSF